MLDIWSSIAACLITWVWSDRKYCAVSIGYFANILRRVVT